MRCPVSFVVGWVGLMAAVGCGGDAQEGAKATRGTGGTAGGGEAGTGGVPSGAGAPAFGATACDNGEFMGSDPSLAEFDARLFTTFLFSDTKQVTSRQLVRINVNPGEAWAANIIESDILSQGELSMAAFNSRLYCALWANDASNLLYVTSRDATSGWVSPAVRQQNVMASVPALGVFQNRLYCAFRAETTNSLSWTSTSDGQSWSTTSTAPGTKLGTPPSLAAFNGKLYAAYHSGDASNQVVIASTADGVTWTTAGLPGILTSARPALVAFRDRLYCAFRGVGPNSTEGLYVTSTTNGQDWMTPPPGYPAIHMAGAPALAVYSDKIYCAYRSDTGQLCWTSATN
jgi:hypothetical protein